MMHVVFVNLYFCGSHQLCREEFVLLLAAKCELFVLEQDLSLDILSDTVATHANACLLHLWYSLEVIAKSHLTLMRVPRVSRSGLQS